MTTRARTDMSVDHCPARTEPGPHNFVEYESPARASSSMWGTTKTPVAVYCKWCGAWSPLTYASNVTPPDLGTDEPSDTMACGHSRSSLVHSPESAAYCQECA
jgi:hypothetical protein